MEEELIQTAITRAYSSLEFSTQELLAVSETRLAKTPRGWYIGIFTPSTAIYQKLVKQLQPLTESLTQVMGTFRIGVCTADDPIPPGGSSVGTITARFLIDMTWYYQVNSDSHPFWCEVAPEDLLQPLL